jgi:hypothetical protein
MKNIHGLPLRVTTFFVLIIFGINLSWAKGLKGNLEKEEIDFIEKTFYPILIEANICKSVHRDCGDDYIKCMSFDTLKCSVYGITDETVIKKIFLAMVNSGLRISSFTFWRSRYHQTSIFEKPLLEYIDRTGDK